MNTATHECQVRSVPIDRIVVHPANRRSEKSPAEDLSLQTSLRVAGQQVPGIGRKIEDKIELIAGARRFKALKKIGATEMLVQISDYTDSEALSIIIIENRDRLNPHPIDQAVLLKKIVETNRCSVEQAGALIGLKAGQSQKLYALNNLTPDWLKDGPAYYEKTLAVIARERPETQQILLETVRRQHYPPSHSDIIAAINGLHNELENAPWDCDDDSLVPEAGACTGCPKRQMPGALFDDVEIGKSGRCTDQECFNKKRTAYSRRKLEEAEQKVGKPLPVIHAGPKEFDRPELKDSWKYRECGKKTKGVIQAFDASKGEIVHVVNRYDEAPQAAAAPVAKKLEPKDRLRLRRGKLVIQLAIDWLKKLTAEDITKMRHNPEQQFDHFMLLAIFGCRNHRRGVCDRESHDLYWEAQKVAEAYASTVAESTLLVIETLVSRLQCESLDRVEECLDELARIAKILPVPIDQIKAQAIETIRAPKSVIENEGADADAAAAAARAPLSPLPPAQTASAPSTADAEKCANKLAKRLGAIQRKIDNLNQPREENTHKRRREATERRRDLALHLRLKTATLALIEAYRTGTVPDEILSEPAIDDPPQLTWLTHALSKVTVHSEIGRLDTEEYHDTGRAAVALRKLVMEYAEKTASTSAMDIEAENRLAYLKARMASSRPPGYFPTPPNVAEMMVSEIKKPLDALILEPSAGSGDLIDCMAKAGYTNVKGIEIGADLCEIVRSRGFSVEQADFVEQCNPELIPREQLFDAVVMNPPFERGQDVDHILHAWEFLKPGGRLVALCSAGAWHKARTFIAGENVSSKIQTFANIVAKNEGRVTSLLDGSFKSSGTSVSVCMLVVEKKAGAKNALAEV